MVQSKQIFHLILLWNTVNCTVKYKDTVRISVLCMCLREHLSCLTVCVICVRSWKGTWITWREWRLIPSISTVSVSLFHTQTLGFDETPVWCLCHVFRYDGCSGRQCEDVWVESSTTAHLFQTGWKRSSHTPVFQLTGQQGIEAFVTKNY